MKSKITSAITGLCFCLSLNAQIKIGNNPDRIDPVSVLELESDKRVLVITRVTTAQMNGMVPLEGAITYNTDTKCLYYYNGQAWQILGEGSGLRITAEAVVYQTPSVLVTQNGGNVNLEVGQISEDHLPELGIGGNKLRNRSVSGEKLVAGSVGNTELRDNAVGERVINFNELTLNDFRNDSGFITARDVLSTEPGNVLSDREGVFYDDSALQTELASLASAIAGHINGGTEGEVQLLGLEGAVVSITGGNSIDLSPVLSGGTDDQNLSGALLNGNILRIEIENGTPATVDLSSLEGGQNDQTAAQIAFVPTGNTLSSNVQEALEEVQMEIDGISAGGNANPTDELQLLLLNNTVLSLSPQSAGEGSVDLDPIFVTESELEAMDFADADADPANELQEITSSDGSVSITPSGNNFDLSVAGGGSDNQDLTSAILTGTSLTIAIEDGASVVADLGALATDAELAQLDINDADADPTNELQEITSSDGSVSITPSGNNFDLSVSGGGSDDQDLTSAILTGTSLTIAIEDGASVVADLGTLATDAELAQLNINDADADPTNELQEITSSDGSVSITPSGNNFDLSVAGLADGINLANSDLTQTGGDRLYHLDGQNLSFSGSGSIGMGTENPQSKLHVSGEVRSSGYANSNGVASEPSYAFTNDPDTGMWRGPNVNHLRFSTAGIEALTISPDQFVGVGTGTPAERLHVIGNILASGTITPDYVFEAYYEGTSGQNPGYHLADLKEVETFIKKYYHLPGVPSAKEVASKGGILVNHATMVNLEKIEELFLYTISQEKIIRQLHGDLGRMVSELELLKKKLNKVYVQLEGSGYE